MTVPTFPCQSLLPRNESGASLWSRIYELFARVPTWTCSALLQSSLAHKDLETALKTCCWKHLEFMLLSAELHDIFVCLIPS